jgi:hypothetical protein
MVQQLASRQPCNIRENQVLQTCSVLLDARSPCALQQHEQDAVGAEAQQRRGGRGSRAAQQQTDMPAKVLRDNGVDAAILLCASAHVDRVHAICSLVQGTEAPVDWCLVLRGIGIRRERLSGQCSGSARVPLQQRGLNQLGNAAALLAS